MKKRFAALLFSLIFAFLGCDTLLFWLATPVRADSTPTLSRLSKTTTHLSAKAARAISSTVFAHGGPDTFGYTWLDRDDPGGPNSDGSRWTEISGTGTPLTLGDDDSTVVPLDFPFFFYGFSFAEAYVCSNGYLSFVPGTCDAVPHNGINEPFYYVAGWWEDLDPSAAGSIYVATVGTPPFRRFIVQFDGVGHYNGPTITATFQIVLHESSQAIEVLHHGPIGSTGAAHYVEIGPSSDSALNAYSSSFPPGLEWGALFMPPPQNLYGGEWYCSSPHRPFPDNGSAIWEPLTLGDSGLVGEISVYLNLPHTYLADLEVTLSRGATAVPLLQQQGGSSDNIVAATAVDGAPAPAFQNFPSIGLTGPFTPAQSLAAFSGQPINGTWYLSVRDTAPGDLGTLSQWCVRVTPARCFATPDDGGTVYSSADAAAVQQAVDAAADGGTVKIAGTCAGVQAGTYQTQTVAVYKPLTLTGGYTYTDWSTWLPSQYTSTLDAQQQGRVILGNKLTVRSLVLKGGKTSHDGGGIKATTLTVIDSLISDNEAIIGGGGIAAYTTTLHHTTLRNNSTNDRGGGLQALLGRVSLQNCRFINNNAANGGGAWIQTTLAVTDTIFSGNVVTHAGGGLFSVGSAPGTLPATLSGVRFYHNVAGLSGGGFAVFHDVTVRNGIFISNTALAGGGLFADEAAMLENLLFAANHATWGGAIDLNGSVTATQLTVAGNSAQNSGGGIFTNQALQVANSIFWDNKHQGVSAPSAQIYVDSGIVTVSHALVQGGYTGTAVLDTDPLFVNPAGADAIPGTRDDNLRLQPHSPAVDAGSNALLPADAGDLDGDGNRSEPLPLDLDRELRLLGPHVDLGAYETPRCWATPDGGSIVFSSSDAAALRQAVAHAPTGSTVRVAGICSGVTYQGGTSQTLSLNKSLVLHGGYNPHDWNTTDPARFPTLLNAEQKGRVLLVQGGVSVTIRGISLTGGMANLGGGVASYGSSLTLVSSTVFSNGSGNGGGFYVSGGSLTLRRSRIAANRADNGGAISSLGGAIIMDGTTLQANSATAGDGGAIYATSGGVTLTRSTLISNSANDEGGGIDLWGASLSLANSILVSNTADDGGGLHASGAADVTVSLVTFSNNRARNGGGGIYAAAPLQMDHAFFVGNHAQHGAGLYLFNNAATLENAVFDGNVATFGGGALSNRYGSITATQVTAVNNSAAFGGAVWSESAVTTTLANSIFWHNANGTGVEIGGSPTAVSFSLVQGGYTGTGNLDADPLFLDAPGPDGTPGTVDDRLWLRPGSPAVDAANPAAPGSGGTACTTTDRRYVPRPQDGDGDAVARCDMGAYELVPILLSGTLALPDTVLFSWSGPLQPVYIVGRGPAPAGTLPWLAIVPNTYYLETEAVANPALNYYYEVQGDSYGVSNRVGVFTFSLVPGQ